MQTYFQHAIKGDLSSKFASVVNKADYVERDISSRTSLRIIDDMKVSF